MTVHRFEELRVYQQARALTNDVYRLTRSSAFARDFGLVDQIRRAAVSVMSNIAEGFERGTSNELVQFLYIAKGSCGEVRAQLTIACDQGYINARESERMTGECRLVSAMLNRFIEYLKDSRFTGLKHKRSGCDPALAAMEEQCRVLDELAAERRRRNAATENR